MRSTAGNSKNFYIVPDSDMVLKMSVTVFDKQLVSSSTLKIDFIVALIIFGDFLRIIYVAHKALQRAAIVLVRLA